MDVMIDGVKYVIDPESLSFSEKDKIKEEREGAVLAAFEEVDQFMGDDLNNKYVLGQLKTHGYFMTHLAPRIYINDLISYLGAPKHSSVWLRSIRAKFNSEIVEDALKLWLINKAYCS